MEQQKPTRSMGSLVKQQKNRKKADYKGEFRCVDLTPCPNPAFRSRRSVGRSASLARFPESGARRSGVCEHLPRSAVPGEEIGTCNC